MRNRIRTNSSQPILPNTVAAYSSTGQFVGQVKITGRTKKEFEFASDANTHCLGSKEILPGTVAIISNRPEQTGQMISGTPAEMALLGQQLFGKYGHHLTPAVGAQS